MSDLCFVELIARAIGYLIDQPWLLNDEKEIDRRFWLDADSKKEAMSAMSYPDLKIKGRESFHIYYPGVSFALNDVDGNVQWNADPWSWSGANPDRYNWAAQPVQGTVYPFLVALYPESARYTEDTGRGWHAVAED